MLDTSLPKYLAIAEWMKENIQNNNFKYGEKLISEHQLCAKFAVSRQTVRQAVATLEHEGLVTRRQGSGTYINHLNPTNKAASHQIGLITTYLDDHVFPYIISGAEKVLSKADYNMTLRLTRNKVHNERTQLLSLLESDIDGLIVEGTKTALPNPNIDVYQKFYDRNIPVVFINAYYQTMTCNYIVNNDVLGARLATRHLIENGHTKIYGIFKHDDQQGNNRYKGFIDEMYDHDFKIDDHRILWYSTESIEELFSPDQLPILTKKLKKCTAVVCYNDQVAMRLIQLFNHSDVQIPKDLSIVSFDNTNAAKISTIPLTSITHPSKEIGKLAAQSILAMIKNPHHQVHYTFTPELVMRESVYSLND
jgi:GntR family transcriptional regulator of arabinose operon